MISGSLCQEQIDKAREQQFQAKFPNAQGALQQFGTTERTIWEMLCEADDLIQKIKRKIGR